MKNKIIKKFTIFFLFTNLFCKTIQLDDAEIVALNFSDQFFNSSNISIFSTYVEYVDDTPIMYIFNLAPNGFIIVSGDDRSLPVIGYSMENQININFLPPQLSYIIESYSDNILDILSNDYEINKNIENSWNMLLNNQRLRDNEFREISPMITANWNQGGEWNDLCPGNSVVGCVAVAMGQVMYYWGSPSQGNGYSQYFDPDHGIISVNFEDFIYDFESMNDNYASEASQLLLYHSGVAVHMDYSPWGSGASVCWDGPSAQAALDENFNYNDDITCETKINYSEEEWKIKMKDQLDRGWPMIYRGYSEDAGHAWNIDGYQDDYFHCNWGWGGSANGYFYFDNLNGGGYNFIENQAALLNIIPDNINPPLALFEYAVNDLIIEFTDLSNLINNDLITEWYWDFGDGQSSVFQNPIHTYSDYGYHNVSLITRNEYGFDSTPHIETVNLIDLTGDINNDSTVDVLDVIFLVEFLLSDNTSIDHEIYEIDLNNDTLINIMDVILLVQIILN